jgi:hypothetical protein
VQSGQQLYGETRSTYKTKQKLIINEIINLIITKRLFLNMGNTRRNTFGWYMSKSLKTSAAKRHTAERKPLHGKMASFGMLRRVAFVRTDVSQELRLSFIRVTRIGALGTTLAVTSNRCMLRDNKGNTATSWSPVTGRDITIFYSQPSDRFGDPPNVFFNTYRWYFRPEGGGAKSPSAYSKKSWKSNSNVTYDFAALVLNDSITQITSLLYIPGNCVRSSQQMQEFNFGPIHMSSVVD